MTQYRLLNTVVPEAEQNKTWWVPYNFAVRGQPNFDDTTPDGWLTKSQKSITINPSPAKDWSNKDWIVFNKQQTSYYRVDYTDDLWKLIIDELHDGNHNLIHYINRAQLLEDAFKWAELYSRTYDNVIGLISYMHKETEYLPWSVFNKHIGNINLYLSGSPQYEEFRVSFTSILYRILIRIAIKPSLPDIYQRKDRTILQTPRTSKQTNR